MLGGAGVIVGSLRLIGVLAAAFPAFAFFYHVGSVGFWLPLYLREHGWSFTEINLLTSLYFAAATVSTPLSGLLADYTKKPGLVLAAGMSLASLSTLGLAAAGGGPAVYPLRLAQAVGLSSGVPIALGWLTLKLGIGRGASMTAAASGAGMAAGAFSAGLLVESLGYSYLFLAASAVTALSAILSAIGAPPPPPGGRQSVFSALGMVPRGVLLAMAALALRNFFASGVFGVLAIVMRSVTGLGYQSIGIALAVNPLVQSLASVALGKLAMCRSAAALYAAGIAGTSLVFQGYLSSDSLPEVIVVQVAQGVFYSMTVVSGNVIMVSLSPPEIRYTASGFYGMAFNAGWIAGTLASGPLMDAFGVETWIRVASIGVLLASLLALTLLRERGLSCTASGPKGYREYPASGTP